MLKDLRKGHQAWLGRLIRFQRLWRYWNIYSCPSELGGEEKAKFWGGYPFRPFAFSPFPSYLMPASAFEEVAHGKPGDNGNDYRQDTISGAVLVSQRGQHSRKSHHDHLQVGCIAGRLPGPLNHREHTW